MSNPEWLSRTKLLLGDERLNKLIKANVLIVGLGGVGAYAAENICRAGIGKITIADGDIYQPSNLNRQLGGLNSTIGKSKAQYTAERLNDINPDISLNIIDEYINDDKMGLLVNNTYDYIIDAIDTISPKIQLISHAVSNKIPLISSMGAGGKLDPLNIKVTDISKSYNCNLARNLRKRLHKMGIYKGFKVVYSPEKVSKEVIQLTEKERNKKSTVGTISYMPPVFGCICASVVINDIINC